MGDDIIGILGGMGSYATVHAFRKILDKFDIEKEWEYPRIIIDNNTKLPSRVRAILYNEQKEIIVEGMCDSIRKLNDLGAGLIFIPCNTAHYFIKDVEEKVPNAKIVNIITSVLEKCEERNLEKVGILASEGTIVSDIYGKHAGNNGLEIFYPHKNKFKTIRGLIEDAKHNNITRKTRISLVNEINSFDSPDSIILACTELSLIWDSLSERQKWKCDYTVIDSLDIGINKVIDLI